MIDFLAFVLASAVAFEIQHQVKEGCTEQCILAFG